jgi:diguanylate cyclase (GGDEF)-like protein
MKRLDLRHRLLLLALLPSTAFSLLLVAYFTFSSMQTLENDLRTTGLATVRYLAPISEYGIIAGQSENLYNLVQATLQQPGIKAAAVVNRKGRIIAVSGRVLLSAEILQKELSSPMLVAETEHWIAYGAPVLRSTNELDPIFESIVAEKPTQAETIGYVFVEMDKTELHLQKERIWQRSLAIIGLGLLLISLLAISMAENIAKPILLLVAAVRKISSGQLATRVTQRSAGAIGELEKGINDMTSHLEEAQTSMQTRIEEATAQLAFQARHDALTGLINRREFETRLLTLFEQIQAGDPEATLLFIDLDRFKPVNDSCGHLAGDELLRQIAQLLASRLREEDTLARLGGDEFGILLNQCHGETAHQVANDLCALAASYRFIWHDKVFTIGASIGLTTISRRARNINDILTTADAACYHAKEAGRNRVVEQETIGVDERRQEPGNYEQRIYSALNEGRLLIDALPICSLQSAAANQHYVQLSAHMNETGQSAVSLSILFELAERYDLAPQLDRLLLEKAIAALPRTHANGKVMHCLVPISTSALCNADTSAQIGRLLSAQNISGEGLHLLISEDQATRHIGQAVRLSRDLKSFGCRLALDEFGGSISSFSHLRTLNPAYVVLSRSLTSNLGGNRASTALLRAIVEITEDLNIQTIAEGIDGLSRREELLDLGVHLAMGLAAGPTEPFDSWLEGAVMRGAH